MGIKTCKFGGTSLADSNCIRRAVEIVRADPSRRFIVPSAPGKRNPDDKKITDLLYAWHNLLHQELDASQPRAIVASRFRQLADELGVDFDVQTELDQIAEEDSKQDTADYMASRGEYLNGQLIARVLDATFVEPAEYIKFDEEGMLDPETYDALGAQLRGPGLFVVPGFYGALPDGRIKTFSRGGSDVTGSIVARASGSTLYENWTDVSGFRLADPRVVPNAKRIDTLTFAELRELSYMGAQVLHDEAIFPVLKPGIPINIRNVNDPENPGTLIVPARQSDATVTGIAGLRGFTMINIAKTLMNKERGFARRVLQAVEQFGISFEHMPTGIDTISIIVKDDELSNHGPAVLKEIERVCLPDRVTLTPGLALVATVGQGMAGQVGVASRLFTALANASINIRVIDQGSSENNIIIGVEEADLDNAVRAIYETFC